MATAEQTYLRTELELRRERLHEALHSPAADASLSELLKAVDTALSRLDQGTFGLCETCHSTIEAERLLADPLVRFCLDHLTSAEQRALESDLSLAARIQRVLLPKPGLAPVGWEVCYHYQPASMVSGDYCDLFEIDEGLLFMLGDVSGKGVAASMVMSHLHATFRTLAEACLPLDRMVQACQSYFLREHPRGAICDHRRRASHSRRFGGVYQRWAPARASPPLRRRNSKGFHGSTSGNVL